MKLAIFVLLALSCFAAITNHTVTVIWSEVVGADSYNVYRAPGTCAAAATFTLRKQGVVGTEWTDSGLTTGTWCYYATALDAGVESEAGASMEIMLKPGAPHIKSLKGNQ